MIKTKLFLLVLFAYNYVLYAQVTNIPYNNFETYFEGNGMTNSDVYNDFDNNTKLETLSCCAKSLARIDVSPLLHLDWLDCVNTGKVNLNSVNNAKLNCTKVNPYELTSLDLSKEHLEALYQIKGNSSSNIELSTTDDLNLKFISVDDSEVSYLTNYEGDVYIYLALADASEEIVFQNNKIDDLTGMEDFIEVWYLTCSDTNLSSIDLSNNELTTQNSSNDRLSDLDFSDTVLPEKFYVNNNFLGAMDVINLSSLEILNFDNIQLSEFDLEKGRLELLSFGKIGIER